jgi:hypothetical protein
VSEDSICERRIEVCEDSYFFVTWYGMGRLRKKESKIICTFFTFVPVGMRQLAGLTRDGRR